MSLNVKKYEYTRIGPRYKQKCMNLVTNDGRELMWANSFRYLGILIDSAGHFSCSLIILTDHFIKPLM